MSIGLENVGREIARDCKGLPLATHVVGGILSQLERTEEAWEEVARDVSSVVTNTNEQFSNILALSYNHFPSHLKPCFLYMAAFPEDHEIRVSKLVKLWVAGEFLKPILHESLEDVAKVYLKALVDRNLIIVHRHETKEHIKSYIMHDLMRDLCIRKAEEEKFLYINTSKLHVKPKGLPLRRCICQNGFKSSIIPVEATKLFRTILVFKYYSLGWYERMKFLLGLQLVQVLDILEIEFSEFPEEILKLINLRYLSLTFESVGAFFRISVLQNLKTICFRRSNPWAVSEATHILMIPKLRHLEFKGNYPEFDLQPWQSFPLQEDLRTLSRVKVNGFLHKLVEAAPNLKKLGIHAEDQLDIVVNLSCLSKLQTLRLSSEDWKSGLLSCVIFPPSLTRLIVNKCIIMEEHMDSIAMLPNLGVLKLEDCKFEGGKWEAIEGGFQSLTYLLLKKVELVDWIADEAAHYPSLQHVIIDDCSQLEEIPIEIGGIRTLETIELKGVCMPSLLDTAHKIVDEQLEMANYALRVDTTTARCILEDSYRWTNVESPKSAREMWQWEKDLELRSRVLFRAWFRVGDLAQARAQRAHLQHMLSDRVKRRRGERRRHMLLLCLRRRRGEGPRPAPNSFWTRRSQRGTTTRSKE